MGGAGYIIAFMSHRALQAKESKDRCVSRRAGLQHSTLPGGKASSEAGKGQHDPLGPRGSCSILVRESPADVLGF